MDCKIVALLGALLLPIADMVVADPALLPHRLELMRVGSHRPVANSRPGVHAMPAATPGTLNFTFFDMPSSTDTEAGALNLGVGGAPMRVVGCYVSNGGAAGSYDAFEYALSTRGKRSTATFETLGPTNIGMCAFAINDSGVVVGTYTPTGLPVGVSLGFVLEGTSLTTLAAPYANTCITYGTAVNDAGTVVGEYQTNVDCTSDHGWAEGGFIWSHGAYTLVPGPAGSIDSIPNGINSAGDIVGGALNASETAAFGWLLRGGVYTELNYPGASITWAAAINDSGAIVGYYCADTFANCDGSATLHGFLYSGGAYSTIDVPGMPLNSPYGINNKGVVSGLYQDTNGYLHSYLIRP